MMLFVLSECLFNRWDDSEENKENLKKFFETLVLINKKEKKHFVILESRRILKLIDEDFKKYMGDYIINYIQEISSSMFLNLKSVEELSLTDIIFLTYDKLDIQDNFRFIPYKYFIESDSLQNLNFITEHILNDEQIFEIIGKYYLSYCINEELKNLFELKWVPNNGGGSNIKDVLVSYCNRENIPLTLFIVDGDMKSPIKPGNGSTARGIKQEFKKCEINFNKFKNNEITLNTNIVNYLKIKIEILKVREIENLIPIKYMEKENFNGIEQYKKLLYVNNEITKFFDVKDGIYCKDKEKNFKSLNDCELLDICTKDMKYYCKILKENGIDFFKIDEGKDILKKFVNYISEDLEKFNELIENCIYMEIKDEILRIGKLIFSWGISIKNVNKL